MSVTARCGPSPIASIILEGGQMSDELSGLVYSTVELGHLKTLEAVRNVLAQAVDNCNGELAWMLPQVTAQLRGTLQEIADIETIAAKRAGGAIPGNEFSTRRANRKSAAQAVAAAS